MKITLRWAETMIFQGRKRVSFSVASVENEATSSYQQLPHLGAH